MRIVFVHRTINDYTVETPYMRGIGGTESALCYLSVELAKRGHSVSLLTNASNPGRYRNVECLNYKTSLTPDLINAADVVVVSNEACGRQLRDEFRAKKPLVMWNQHADDQPCDRSARVHARAQGVDEHRLRQRVAAGAILQRLLDRS